MNELKLCVYCGGTLEGTKTTFTVAKPANVYVIHDVPTLECSGCGDQSYEQAVAKRLERVASGRWGPSKSIPAWVYHWADQWEEFSQQRVSANTYNPPLVQPITSHHTLVRMR